MFFQLAVNAEQAFAADPNTTLIKLHREIGFEPQIKDLFHTLRIEGNKATHQFKTKHKEALDGLKVARSLAVWFHRAFAKNADNFKPGPFVAPPDPSAQLSDLQDQIQQLSSQLVEANQQLESDQKLNELIKLEKEEYLELAEEMDKEAKSYQQQLTLQEEQRSQQIEEFESKIAALQEQLEKAPTEQQEQAKKQQKVYSGQLRKASKALYLNEEVTRIVIDQHLVEAGWEADTQSLTYQKGIRPQKGKNLAIAEWPTELNGKKGYADYVLFCGLTPIGIVEAKKENTNVAGKMCRLYTPAMDARSLSNWPNSLEHGLEISEVTAT